MLNDLKEYYEGELQYLHQVGGIFASRYPKIANRLGLSKDGVRDPHAERIVQGVALLNARIRKKLDDEFPEIVESLLDLVYPHFLRPFPSTAIASFQLDSSRGDPTSAYHIPSGSLVETSPVGGQELSYRTCGDLTLWPIRIRDAKFMERPFDGIEAEVPDSQAVLRIHLQAFSDSIPMAQLNINQIRLYLNLSPISVASTLFEMLLEDVLEITISNPQKPRDVIRLGNDIIRAGRRTDSEALLPDSPQSFSGYRVLTEQFACPESFLFLDVCDLEGRIPEKLGSEIYLDIFLSRESQTLARNVKGSSIDLGAIPIVNLFPKTATDVPVSGFKSEQRVIADAQKERGLEIYSIMNVEGVKQDGSRVPIRPFYSSPHGSEQSLYWHATRKQVRAKSADDDTSGYDSWISLGDLRDEQQRLDFDRLQVETICFNRNIPNQLEEGGRLPQLRLADGSRSVGVSLLNRPTPTRRPPGKDRTYWDLLSHLSLNYLSLESVDSRRPDAFRHLLRLYEPFSDRHAQNLSRGITCLSCRPDVAILPDVIGGFCRGIEVTVELDDEIFVGNSAYLFAMALNDFLCRYVSVNSFSRLIAMTTSMKEKGKRWRWSPRSGTRTLL